MRIGNESPSIYLFLPRTAHRPSSACWGEGGFATALELEVQARIHHEAPLACCCCNTPEVRRIDVRTGEPRGNGNAENRVVQYIDSIQPEFKLLRFRDPHALDQVGIEAD